MLVVSTLVFILMWNWGEGLHAGDLILEHLQLVLGSTRLVGVAELDGRLVSEEAFGVAGTAGDIVGGLLHVDLGEELQVGALVLVHPGRLVRLEGGRGHWWTEGVVAHGAGHVLGAGLLVQLGVALVQLDLVCAALAGEVP